MAPRKPRRNTARSEEAPRRPLNPDEYLKLDNRPAAERIPKALRDAVNYRLTVYAPSRGFEPKTFKRSQLTPDAWELDLPAGVRPGLPGRNAGRLSPAEVSKGTKASAHGEPFLPKWVDYTPHPKLSSSTKPLLQGGDGRLIRPHYGVFGSDDRQVYYPSGYPWTCIGKVLVWNDFSQPYYAWSGSGVLIGGRVVLTAGHMAPWGSSNWAMQFIPAYYDGGSALGPGVMSWVSDYYGYDTNDQVSAWDMLVLRLYTPLGNIYGYFGAKTYDSSWEGGNYWTLAGYPGAIAGANRPARQMWFPIVDDDSDGSADKLEFYADSTPGDSGGPVFGFWSEGPYAVGTASGGEEEDFLWWTIEDDNAAAGGSAMVDLARWARSNWP